MKNFIFALFIVSPALANDYDLIGPEELDLQSESSLILDFDTFSAPQYIDFFGHQFDAEMFASLAELSKRSIDAETLKKAIVWDPQKKQWIHLNGKPYENQGAVKKKQQASPNLNQVAKSSSARPDDSDSPAAVAAEPKTRYTDQVYYSQGWGNARYTWPGDLRTHVQRSPHNKSKEWAESQTANQLITYHNLFHDQRPTRSSGWQWFRRRRR